MDILASQGELSPGDLTELAAMEKDELVALVTGMNRGWYQLLERLEDAHRQDLARATETYSKQIAEARRRFETQLAEALKSTRESESGQLSALQRQLTSLEKELASGTKASAENTKKLDSVKSTFEKLWSFTARK